MTVGHMPYTNAYFNWFKGPFNNTNLTCHGKCSSDDGDFGENTPCKPCAFPSRFERWLRKAYPELNVNVINLAVPATTSQSILGILGTELEKVNAKFPSGVDIFYINYSDNDRNFFERDWIPM
jgi:hypothetical protein